jgi:hypothetical protein
MGVIRFTQKDLDRNRPWDAGWRECEVTGITEKMAKKKDSINKVVSFKVDVDGEERSYDHTFSEKAMGMMAPFVAAVTKAEVSAEVEYEEASFVGTKLFVEFTKEIYKDANNPNDRGRPVNKAINFASTDNPPF